MTTPRIVVLGGGYAGVLAALRAKSRGGAAIDVSLVSEGDSLVERIRLHELAVRDRRVQHPFAKLLRGTSITHEKARVKEIRVGARSLQTSRGDISYDRLIVTAGSSTAVPDVAGAENHAYFLELDARRGVLALRSQLGRLACLQTARVVVCGGGLSGIEIAAEIAETHATIRVALVTSGEVGALLTPVARAEVRRVLARLGVELHERTNVLEIAEDRVVTDAGELLTGACVWTGGFRASPLLASAGLATNHAGQCLVDPFLRALSRDDIFVAGDAASPVVVPGSPIVPGCKTAMPMGAHAAGNAVRSLLGTDQRAFDFRDTGYCVSLGRKSGVIDAQGFGMVIKNRMAAFVKERVCRYTVSSLHWERSGLLRYRWLSTGHAPKALPAHVPEVV